MDGAQAGTLGARPRRSGVTPPRGQAPVRGLDPDEDRPDPRLSRGDRGAGTPRSPRRRRPAAAAARAGCPCRRPRARPPASRWHRAEAGDLACPQPEPDEERDDREVAAAGHGGQVRMTPPCGRLPAAPGAGEGPQQPPACRCLHGANARAGTRSRPAGAGGTAAATAAPSRRSAPALKRLPGRGPGRMPARQPRSATPRTPEAALPDLPGQERPGWPGRSRASWSLAESPALRAKVRCALGDRLFHRAVRRGPASSPTRPRFRGGTPPAGAGPAPKARCAGQQPGGLRSTPPAAACSGPRSFSSRSPSQQLRSPISLEGPPRTASCD